jgi:hypothetical protein
MDVITILGVVGTGLILVGFVGNRLSYWNAVSRTYVILNSLGSSVLIYYSWYIESYPFVVLNCVWFVSSLNGLLRRKK